MIQQSPDKDQVMRESGMGIKVELDGKFRRHGNLPEIFFQFGARETFGDFLKQQAKLPVTIVAHIPAGQLVVPTFAGKLLHGPPVGGFQFGP